jgi:folate-binding protein YgfZ
MIICVMNSLPMLNGVLRLTDWGVIRAQGADAASFLQGQLTQDVVQLPESQARLAGYCSAKGRLLASFVVWRADAQTFYLACSADLLTPTLKRLTMFVMRAKCQLSDVSADLALHGLAGTSAAMALGAAAPAMPWGVLASASDAVIRLPDAAGQPRFLLVRSGAELAQASSSALSELPALAPADWSWLEVQSGVARIVAATVERFVPQMVNLELVGGVNFQKGCFPGQEVVARSQYRGTLKRRAMLFDSAADLAVGQEVFHSADPGQPAGQVVLAAARPGGVASETAGGSSALIEVKLAALAAGSLHAGAADGPLLTPCALPYPIPAEQG